MHVIFQPHRYSRTASLADEFGPAFAGVDSLTVLGVYAAGEDPIEGVSGRLVADSVRACGSVSDVSYIEDFDEAIRSVVDRAREGDLVITMGAGSVTKLGPGIVDALSAR